MAVFMVNICKFNGCGLTFQSLGELIWHIEDNHIDYDPLVVEQKEQQQPQCMPLSYILPFFTDAARKDHKDVKPKMNKPLVTKTLPSPSTPTNVTVQSSTQSVTPNVEVPVSRVSPAKPVSVAIIEVTPKIRPLKAQSRAITGNEADDDELMSELEDSNDSWTTPEEFSSEFILRYGSKMVTPSSPGPNGINLEKPFACPVPGCKKRYKNVNGIKYHSKNGHKHDGRVRKGFKCHCGKSYKTASGLKNHTTVMHSGANMTTITTQTGEVLQVPSSQVTIQPIRALTLKHIASLGLPVKTLVVATKTVDKSARPVSPPTPTLGVLTPATSPDSPLSSPSSPPSNPQSSLAT
ncbi:juxtaposed with another zinc finger protein 1 isoform X1 [Macrosteles quadrilineatus]|uniref:juxtaposed with another zinc finger protein 1 isoform X1 n=1 Tax=Macrosteles quadrilineatus TaxID=74068 RepID=UPI0023E2B329|nr:juxtaposed with another zinc finger protein 1 isoform X1 [Macrosteles quadrilineatus]